VSRLACASHPATEAILAPPPPVLAEDNLSVWQAARSFAAIRPYLNGLLLPIRDFAFPADALEI